MKTSVRRLATRLLILSLSSSLTVPLLASQDWFLNYEEALAAAKREGKPIFADFSTTWCHNCKQLDRETLSDPNIAARLDNYIKVRIDGDQRADIVQRYQVDAYPTLLTLDCTGKLVDKTVGFVRAPQLAGTLDNQRQLLAPAPSPMQTASVVPTAAMQDTTLNINRTAPKNSEISKPVLESRFSAPVSKSAESRVSKAADAKLSTSLPPDAEPNTRSKKPAFAATKSEALPLSQAEAKFRAATGSKPRTTAQATGKASSPPLGNEIVPLLNASRSVSPGGGGALRHSDDELLISQAEPRKTPASSVTEDPAADEELPKPLLKTGSRGSQPAAAESAKTENGSNAVKKETKAKPADSGTATTEAPADEADAMSTIRKLQKTGKSAKAGTTASAPADTSKATTSEKSTAASEETKTEPAAKTSRVSSTRTASPKTDSGDAPPASSEPKGESSAPGTDSADKSESGEETKAAEITQEDVDRWIKDADSKLIAGHKREARAMYAQVFEKDPQNRFGKTDMAFIKMVSLMVDQDDDALRRKALNKIKEFEALFPDSDHKDYYTLIRATLAADLGDSNSAHRLLETFAVRFPDSKYQKLAYETWKSLPPVKKEQNTKEVAAKEGESQKSSAKKKKSSE